MILALVNHLLTLVEIAEYFTLLPYTVIEINKTKRLCWMKIFLLRVFNYLILMQATIQKKH